MARPDDRGEADLRTLVGEAPVAVRAPAAARVALRPILVAAVVLVLVVTGSALVLARTGVPNVAAPAPSITGTPTIDGCDPVALRPFLCGSYISNEATKNVTGDNGDVTNDPLTISFTRSGGGYVLHAVGKNCFTETLPFRLEASAGLRSAFRLAPTGKPVYGQHDCFGPGVDQRGWAYPFLRGELVIEDGGGSTGAISFSQGKDTIVDFAFVGSTGTLVGRTDPRCVAAHVAPFSCAKYRSVSGTGSLAFLDSDRYTLRFEHANGVLTAVLIGHCNALDQTFEVAGDEVVAFEGGASAELCLGSPGRHDAAVGAFVTGVLAYRIDGDRITFWKGSESAVFER